MKNKIPKFKSEADERAFWASHYSADYVDWKKGKNVIFPNLRPTLKDRKSTRLNSSHIQKSRMPSSA